MSCTKDLEYLLALSLLVMSTRACTHPANGPVDADVDEASESDVQDSDVEEEDADNDVEEAIDPRPSVHESFIPEELRPTSAARVIVLGDSIAFGRRATSELRTFYGLLIRNDDEAFPEEQGNDLETFFGSDVPLVNVSMDGASTGFLGSLLSELETTLELPVEGHTIVVVSIGFSDLATALATLVDPVGEVLDEAIDNIGDMVEWFDDQRFPDGVSMYLTMGAEPSDGVGHIAFCFDGMTFTEIFPAGEVWHERLTELAADLGFAFIDASRHFKGHGYYHDDTSNPYYDPIDPTLWFVDCLYLNDRGHSELRRLFYEAIDRSYWAD